jgi:hypothetical protein
LQNYPTPTSRDWKGKQANEYKDERGEENNMKFASLPGVVDKLSKPNWPTASASDTEGGTQADRVEWTQKGATLRKKNKPHMTYGAKLRDAVESHEKLNWATPNTMDHLQAGISGSFKESLTGRRKRSINLREQVNPNWPTPRAGNPGSRKPGTGGKILAEEAKKNWPTPTAMSRPRSEETMEKCLKFRKSKGKNTVPLYLEEEIRIQEAKIHAGPPAQEKSSTSGKSHGSPKLNPNWVEQLMGLPVGWTQLPTAWTDSASSETALSPKPQN